MVIFKKFLICFCFLGIGNLLIVLVFFGLILILWFEMIWFKNFNCLIVKWYFEGCKVRLVLCSLLKIWVMFLRWVEKFLEKINILLMYISIDLKFIFLRIFDMSVWKEMGEFINLNGIFFYLYILFWVINVVLCCEYGFIFIC